MKKKLVAGMMVFVMSITLFACGNSDKAEPDEVVDSIDALTEEVILSMDLATEEAMQKYAEAKDKEESEKKKKELKKKKKQQAKKKKQEEPDKDDPMNADQTEYIGKNQSKAKMRKRYAGTWTFQGVVLSDGNLDMSTKASGKYVFKKDGTYTFKGKNLKGKKIKESGKWKLDGSKRLIAGKYTLGIDGSGYLLKDSGQRDGKGRKMKYAFAKN